MTASTTGRSRRILEHLGPNCRVVLTEQKQGGEAASGAMSTSYKLYIGCYTEKQWWVNGEPGPGLVICNFDAETGSIKQQAVVQDIVSPSWTTVHPNKKVLYVVTEKGPEQNVDDSVIVSYSVAADGLLTKLNEQKTLGLGANCVGSAACTQSQNVRRESAQVS